MENRGSGRRGRRRRQEVRFDLPPDPNTTDFSFNFLKNKNLICAAIICLTFIMLQYNCKNCCAKQELVKITNSVEDIAKHLATIQNSYQVMEKKLMKFSQEIPKLEEQMSTLEAISRAMEPSNRYGWNPRIHAALPYVDVKLHHFNKPAPKLRIRNVTRTSNASTNSINSTGTKTVNV